MAQVLYAARGGSATTSDLYTVDPVTSATTSVGATGFGLTGLAFDPTTDILYGATNANSSAHPKSLITIDPTTGAGTFVATFGGLTIPDIAFTAAGQMYGWNANVPNKIGSIDKATGTVTLLGASGVSASFGNGLSINSSDVYYICPFGTNGDFYSGNLSTGALTDLGVMDASGLTDPTSFVNAVSFDALDVFWALCLKSAVNVVLATMNTSTRVWTQIGTGLGGTANWDALAWGPETGGGGGGGGDLEGVCIAFDDTALTASPTWTRID